MQTLLRRTGAYQLLKKEGESTGFSHAYLLLLDDAKFLRTALKTFAKLLFNCDMPTSHAQKRISDLIDSESFSDCVMLPAEGKKLTVEDVETLLEESTLAPVEGNKKVFLVGNFAEASVQTQNKLLKLLEEPPQGVHLLLGATSAFPVLPTVLSRTKKLEISPFSVPEITECLSRLYQNAYDDQTLNVCAAAAAGSVGAACDILEGGYYKTLTENAFLLALATPSRLPVLVKQIGETPHKKELLCLLRLIFRDALLLKNGGNERHLLLPFERIRTGQVCDEYNFSVLLYAQEAISEAEKQVTFNAVFSQCIELCIANILTRNKI